MKIKITESKLRKIVTESVRRVLKENRKYLNDAIKSVNSDKVRILFTGEMKPFIIKDLEREDIIQLVLPVRTY